jgi:hypothetical protein
MEDGNRASDNERPLYKNDQQKRRSSCQKKKVFVRMRSSPLRRPGSTRGRRDLLIRPGELGPRSVAVAVTLFSVTTGKSDDLTVRDVPHRAAVGGRAGGRLRSPAEFSSLQPPVLLLLLLLILILIVVLFPPFPPDSRPASSFCTFVARPYATKTTGTHPLGRNREPRAEFRSRNLARKHLALVPNRHGAAPRPGPPPKSGSSALRKRTCENGFGRSISFVPPGAK